MTSRYVTLATAGALSLALAGCGTANSTVTATEPVFSLGPASCPNGAIQGSGTAAQESAMFEVLATYAKRCDYSARVDFEASSSAQGVDRFIRALDTWAATDAPLADDRRDAAAARCKNNAVGNLPTIVTPIAVAYNLPGLDEVTLTPAVLAEILSGRLTRWNDPALTAINPGVDLPDQVITVVGHEDGSGPTRALNDYLSATTRATWPVEDPAVWPGVGDKRPQSGDALGEARGRLGAITYAEFGVTSVNGLQMARIDNGAGPVELTAESAAAGLSTAQLSGEGSDLRLDVQYAGTAAGAYPINLVTYQVVCSRGLIESQAPVVRDFLTFLTSEPQQVGLAELGYTPLPDDIRSRVNTAANSLR